jgi:hypothetical protein
MPMAWTGAGKDPFADHWEVVEYAQSHKLNLDFTAPPVRYGAPEAAAR